MLKFLSFKEAYAYFPQQFRMAGSGKENIYVSAPNAKAVYIANGIITQNCILTQMGLSKHSLSLNSLRRRKIFLDTQEMNKNMKNLG